MTEDNDLQNRRCGIIRSVHFDVTLPSESYGLAGKVQPSIEQIINVHKHCAAVV
jgi:hypothetical protein